MQARLIGVIFLILLALLAALWLVTGSALAQANPGALYEKGAKREMVKARKAYREALRVSNATRYYSRHDYSDFAGRYVEPVKVGRWVALARKVGWKWGCIDNLCHIMARESSGFPGVTNSEGSGATGLLQILRSNVTQPDRLTEPRYNLAQGLRLFKVAGWGPWAL